MLHDRQEFPRIVQVTEFFRRLRLEVGKQVPFVPRPVAAPHETRNQPEVTTPMATKPCRAPRDAEALLGIRHPLMELLDRFHSRRDLGSLPMREPGFEPGFPTSMMVVLSSYTTRARSSRGMTTSIVRGRCRAFKK